MPQTVLGATCSFSCHPENYHQDIHHHPASADVDHPNQGPLQEMQGKFVCGGGGSYQLQATICTGQQLTAKHFIGKQELWILLVSVLKTWFLVSMLKTITH